MWKILSTEVAGDTLNVRAEFTFADDSVAILTVPCFMPANKEAVIDSLDNREISEQRVRDAAVKNAGIKKELDADIG